MTLALKYGDDSDPNVETGFIYFDVVTAYSRSTRGQVTKHAISGGTYVTDHFVRDNPEISISAIVSFADISPESNLIVDVSGNKANNSNPQTGEVIVTESASSLVNYLPASISQYLPKSAPTVSLASNILKTNYKDFVEQALETITSSVKFNESTSKFETYIRVTQLYEFLGTSLTKIKTDLVLTEFSIKEDESSGDALLVDLKFEKVKFVSQKRTAIPKDITNSLKKKAITTQKKGVADSTITAKDSANDEDIDPARKVYGR